jgi:uncharacterized protein
MDLSHVPRMEPEDVVTASLRDLEKGVVVSIPALRDRELLDRVLADQAELFAGTRHATLPGHD